MFFGLVKAVGRHGVIRSLDKPWPTAGTNYLREMMVRSRRLELPPHFWDSDLNAARLPVPPRPHTAYRPTEILIQASGA